MKIYLHCIERTGKKYDEIFMIDDSKANLERLPEIGITPILFESVQQLENKLKEIL